MPSLAKKSMNFIRDVYTAASNPDRPLLHPQGFQPTTGLSTQFVQPNIPYQQSPSSPYLQPFPVQGQYQQPQGLQTPYSSQYHGQQPTSSNNAWSTPLPSQAPPHTPSPTTPLVHNTYLNHPYNAVSPNAPPGQYQPYGLQQPISGQHMFIPPKPPLPPRAQSQPWQNAESLLVTPAAPSATPGYSPPPPHSAPPSVATCHSNNDRFQHLAELPATRPVPPPLPQRSPTQQVRPELLHEAEHTVRSQMQSSSSLSPSGFMVNDLWPPMTTYYELPAEPASSTHVQQHQFAHAAVSAPTSGRVELPAANYGSEIQDIPAQERRKSSKALSAAVSTGTSSSIISPKDPGSTATASSQIPPTATTPVPEETSPHLNRHHDDRPNSSLSTGRPLTEPSESPSLPYQGPIVESRPFDVHQMAAVLNDIHRASPRMPTPSSPVPATLRSDSNLPYPNAMVTTRPPSNEVATTMYAQTHQAQTPWNSIAAQLIPVAAPKSPVSPSILQNYDPRSAAFGSVVANQQPFPRVDAPQHHSELHSEALRVGENVQKPRVRKILCLDGGGVRGLSELIIIDHLMDSLAHVRGARLEPWQEFDMIAGTSTGGLIALMLGRLRMSVKDCIKAYKEMSKEIFTPSQRTVNLAGRSIDFLHARGRFKSEPLGNSIKQMLRFLGLSEDELLADRDSDSPAVFVCAVEGINSDAVVIRSYKSREFDDLKECRIWEAARATSAASRFFDPIKIGDRLYVDGALKHNNPIEKVDEESRGKF